MNSIAARDSYDRPSIWEHCALASGVMFVALLLIAAFVIPGPPGEQGSPAHNPAWLASHQSAALIQVYVRGIAAVAQLIFIAGIVMVSRRAEGHISILALLAFGGGIIHTVMMLLSNAVTAAAAIGSGQGIDAGVVQGLGVLSDAILGIEPLAEALLFGAAAATLLRTHTVPRWIGWFGLIGVPLSLLGSASYPGTPLDVVGFVALLFELVWFACASIVLLLHTRSRRSPQRSQGAATERAA